jgi:hypothetical protein
MTGNKTMLLSSGELLDPVDFLDVFVLFGFSGLSVEEVGVSFGKVMR